MRIGIDARFWNEAGLGRYIRNLVFQLQKIDSKNEYYLFLRQKDFDAAVFNNNFHKVLADFTWYGFEEQIKFPPLLKQYNLDLVHFPHFNIPLFYNGKFIVTIHDLTHLDFKMQRASTHNAVYYHLKHAVYKNIFPKSLKRASKILTVSDYVRAEIVNRWKIDKQKVVVTHEAVEENIIKLAAKNNSEQNKKILQKFAVKPPFIFYVGNAHPHKNIEGLIKAFLTLRKKYQYLQLVLSGKENYFWTRIKKEFSEKDIIYTGLITDQELVALFKESKAFVFPSFSEGFGIPLLEAMACSSPVVASNLTSLPEVAGDAAIYFDPKNTDDMAEKIMSVINSESLRKELIVKGEKRYKQFSWESLAKKTLEIYKQCE